MDLGFVQGTAASRQHGAPGFLRHQLRPLGDLQDDDAGLERVQLHGDVRTLSDGCVVPDQLRG